jgi:DNA ligase (NAD+)
LPRFVISLSIPQVGEETAIDLANYFGEFEKIRNASYDELDQLNGIGPVVAGALVDWCADKENKEFVDRLLKQVRIEKYKKPEARKLPLSGKSFVITGTLSSMSRDEAHQKIRDRGGSISSAVSKKTTYVVAGDNPGSKLEKAKLLGVTILTEEAFSRLIR